MATEPIINPPWLHSNVGVVTTAPTTEIERLRAALKDCADRLERAAILAGSGEEYAALAVKRYRDLLAVEQRPLQKSEG